MAWARVAQQRCGMALGMVLLLDFGSGVGSPLSFQALILYWAVGVVLFSYGVNLRGAFGSSARWASSWLMRWPQVKDWRVLDSIYFCIVTFFTVTAATPANRSRCATAVYIPPRRSGRLRGHDDADQMRPSAGKLVLRRNMRAEHAGSVDCH